MPSESHLQQELNRLLEWKWYTQGVPASPIHILSVSGVPAMHEGLGFSYHAIIGLYKNGYGEWNYPISDLETHGEAIIKRLEKDPQYLKKIRAHYDTKLKEFENIFQKAEGNLEALSKKELKNN